MTTDQNLKNSMIQFQISYSGENHFLLKNQTPDNMKRPNNRVSKYIGVGWNRELQKWRSSVSGNGIKYDCGYHESERDAAKARDHKILALGLKKPLQILKAIA